MIDVRKLRMLAALERLGTVAAVAVELHLTASGVSMQLSALERELGVALTERQGRRLSLTPAGKLLAAHAREILDRLTLTELEVDALRRGVSGSYSLAAFPSAARTFVADAWQAALSQEAGIQITLTTPEPEEAINALVAGETDLAVIHSYSNLPRRAPEGIEAAPIVTEPVWLAIRSDDAMAGTAVDLAEFRDRNWVTPTPEVTCFEMVDRACGLAGFGPSIVAQTMDFTVQMALVRAGVGVALVPDLTVAHVPQGVILARLQQPVTREIHASRRTTMRADPGLDRIVEMLRDAAAKHIRSDLPG